MSRPNSALKLCFIGETRTLGQHIQKLGYAEDTYKTMVKAMIFGVAFLQDVLTESSIFYSIVLGLN